MASRLEHQDMEAGWHEKDNLYGGELMCVIWVMGQMFHTISSLSQIHVFDKLSKVLD